MCLKHHLRGMNLTDWVGSAGVFLLLLAFFLVAINATHPKSVLYIVLNLLGGVLAGLASWLLDYWPFILLEAAWVSVSVFSLIKHVKNTPS
jgi:hypothetical protein